MTIINISQQSCQIFTIALNTCGIAYAIEKLLVHFLNTQHKDHRDVMANILKYIKGLLGQGLM
jgi:hypothetical protein